MIIRIKLITKIKLFGGEIPIAYVISLIFGMTMNCNRYYHFVLELFDTTGFSIPVLPNPPPHLTGASFIKYSKIVERTHVSSHRI